MTLKRLTRINFKNVTAYSMNVHGMFSSNMQAKEIRAICKRVLIRAMCSSNRHSSNQQASFLAIRGINISRNKLFTISCRAFVPSITLRRRFNPVARVLGNANQKVLSSHVGMECQFCLRSSLRKLIK